jgi:2-succinyl-5-enolpyruvyl-6-hydroxy-3-cyclohexene-1-carboxylate synthase
MNMQRAADILKQLAEQNVQTICICPGARNAPFVKILSATNQFEVISFFDERSAGFFALGRARRDNTPVVICTTSGTAVSELLSPVIEAFYSNTSIIVLSADRPKRLRHTGAPQTIAQNNIFKNFVEESYDFEVFEAFRLKKINKKPIHINVCFDEPLIDKRVEDVIDLVKQGSAVLAAEKTHWQESKKEVIPIISNKINTKEISLVVLGALNSQQRPNVENFLKDINVPIFAESLSGLKNSTLLKSRLLLSGDRLVCEMIKKGVIHRVLRIGDIPVGRFWRDLDLQKIPVINISDKDFSGLQSSELYISDYNDLDNYDLSFQDWNWQYWKNVDEKQYALTKKLLEEFPLSEVALLDQLQNKIAADSLIYLGNSLPVREWDLINHKHVNTWASRGVNGIDGQLSTAMGLHKKATPTWVVLGDLTTLYDFSAFWLSHFIKNMDTAFSLVVINNKGGQIFSRLFSEKLFLNEHNLNFFNLAQMWGWEYFSLTDFNQFNSNSNLNLIELLPDSKQTQDFWKKYDSLWTI